MQILGEEAVIFDEFGMDQEVKINNILQVHIEECPDSMAPITHSPNVI